jgi:hypothetical protein
MAVEQWIDALCKRWGTVSDGKGALVRSYLVYERREFPEALDGSVPSAITFTTECRPIYSQAQSLDLWNGITEFHLAPNISRAHYPDIMRYFARIRDAAAGTISLNSLVSEFVIRTDIPGLVGPVRLRYGEEAEHLGIVVNWKVKEIVTVTVGA